jgi:phosphoribosylglycinamide formyltransferase-1
MAHPLRLGVLASGSGSNLQSILDACAARRISAEVAAVICNVPGARALQRAREARVPAVLLPHQEHARREDYDARLVAELRSKDVELVCLAGFMRIVTPVLLSAFPQRVLNIHPSLLPAFPGMHGVRQALRAGVRVSGCTVHFVDEGTDSGPILIQAAVPVLEGDTEESLAARILAQEHRIYPRAIQLVAEGRAAVEGGRVGISGPQGNAARTLSSPPVDER